MNTVLQTLIEGTPTEALPQLAGELATAQAVVIARLAGPPSQPKAPELVVLSKEWAATHGLSLDAAQKAARYGRIPGAQPAPSARGKGSRRRWLVPARLTATGGQHGG